MRNIWAANITILAICLGSSSVVQAQSSHPAACHVAPSISHPPSDIPVVEKVVASLGDPNVLASLRGIRYTTTISVGAIKLNTALTRIYPNHLIIVTSGAGVPETRIEASPNGAYRQTSGGPKTQFPDDMAAELLKTVQYDRFYVGQNMGSIKVKVTDAGTEKIADIEATMLRLDIAGSNAVWYVNPLDGTVLRTVARVPSATGMIDQAVDYSDWRVCDGLTIPFQRTTTQGSQITQETVLTVEFNPDVSGPEPATSDSSAAVTSKTLAHAANLLSDDEVQQAISGKQNDRWVTIEDMGLMAAQGNQVPKIILFMPKAVLAIRAEAAKKQFIKYEPTEEDKRRSLMIVAQGYAGKTIAEGCTSITRVVLLSDPSGGVLQEAYLSEPLEELWRNSFGATNNCQALRTKFSLDDVQKVKAAAANGEFFVAVFSGSVNTKTYKVKKKYQSKLGLD